MEKLKFCLLTSFFNSEKYIHDCINSVINQTYKNWIWIVSDDGSSDDTKNILIKYCHENPNIIYYDQAYKAELVKNINKFVPVECDYFMMMDSDDKLLDTCLQVYNKILIDHKNDNIVFASCEASWTINDARQYPSLLYLHTNADPEDEKKQIGCNVWGNLRAIKNIKNFRFIAMDEPGNENYYCYIEDNLFYIQMQKFGNFLTIKRNLYDFTRRSDSVSVMNDVRTERCKLSHQVIDDFIKQNELIGKSIKTWEKDLYDDANAFLMSGFNFDSKFKVINFFSNSLNDFTNLYKLYYDKQLMINHIYNDFEYCIVNTCHYDIEGLKNIFNIIKIKKPLEVCIYLNEYKKNFEMVEFEDLIRNTLSYNFFWSSHGPFLYYIITNL
jgi:glycosyltransferase involved in cell wall biosynthesis